MLAYEVWLYELQTATVTYSAGMKAGTRTTLTDDASSGTRRILVFYLQVHAEQGKGWLHCVFLPCVSIQLGLSSAHVSNTVTAAARGRISLNFPAVSTCTMDRKSSATRFISVPRRLDRSACRVAVAVILSRCCCLAIPEVALSTAICGRARPAIGLPAGSAATNRGCSRLVCKIPRRVREPRRQAPGRSNAEKEARALTSRITKASSAAELLDLLGQQVRSTIFNEYHLTAFMTRLARFKRGRQLRQSDSSSSALAKLADRLYDMLRQDLLSPRSTSNAFYAVGELYEQIEKHLPQLLPKLCDAVRSKAGDMEAQGLSNCVLAATKLHDVSPDVLVVVPALARSIRDKAVDMNPQELSNSLLAAAKLHDASPEVLTAVPAIAKQIPNKVGGMKPQELSNSLWAAEKLQDASPEALDAVPALTNRIQHKVEDLEPQGLSNCLLAAAKLQDSVPEVLDAVPALAKRIPDKIEDMIPQHLSNCLWAAAKLQDASPEVLEAVPALAKRIPDKVDDMIPQGLSSCLLASAKLQDASPDVLAVVPVLAKSIPSNVDDMNPQELSNILVAAAKLQDSGPEVLKAVPCVVRCLQKIINTMDLQGLATNFWAAGKLKDASPEVLALVPKLIERISPAISQFVPEGLYMSLWAAQQFEERALAARLQAELDRRQR